MPLRLFAVCLLLLSGCAPALGPSAGLNRESYGPLSYDALLYCNDDGVLEHDPVNEASGTLAHHGVGLLAMPRRGVLPIDPAIKEQNLQGHFNTPFTTQVALLDYSTEGAVFWWTRGPVMEQEVSAAAEDYCQRLGKKSVYDGAAQQCGMPHELPAYMGMAGEVASDTHVISAFRCTGGAPARRQSRRRDDDDD